MSGTHPGEGATTTNLTSNDLALIGFRLVYTLGIKNLTAVQLAAQLRQSIDENVTYLGGQSVAQIVGGTLTPINDSITDAQADAVLEGFAGLPDDRVHGIAVTWMVLACLSTCLVGMRLYSKWNRVGGMRRDDWALLLAWLQSTASIIEDCVLVYHHNWEAHLWNITLSDIRLIHLIRVPDNIFYLTSALALKTSLLLFFYEIYHSFRFRQVVKGVLIFIWLYSISGIFLTLFRCLPADEWNHPLHQVCFKGELGVSTVWIFFNILSDITIVILPMPMVYRLNLPFNDKIILTGLFSLGGFVCVASVIRVLALREYLSSEHQDTSQGALPLTTWSFVEVQVGIICACMPAFRTELLRMQAWARSIGSRAKSFVTKASSKSEGSSNGRRPGDDTNSNAHSEGANVIDLEHAYGIHAAGAKSWQRVKRSASGSVSRVEEDIGLKTLVGGLVVENSDDEDREGEILVQRRGSRADENSRV